MKEGANERSMEVEKEVSKTLRYAELGMVSN